MCTNANARFTPQFLSMIAGPDDKAAPDPITCLSAEQVFMSTLSCGPTLNLAAPGDDEGAADTGGSGAPSDGIPGDPLGPEAKRLEHAAKDAAGRLVIGKLPDLGAEGALGPDEYRLQWPKQGSASANWARNSGLLRGAMARGGPIRDVTVDPLTGDLQKDTGFLSSGTILAWRAWLDLRSEDNFVESPVSACGSMMPKISPSSDRSLLGFAQAVEANFGFLVSKLEFRLVDVQATFVRYESERTFVNVFHGRGSYELGVEIGHWIEVDGGLVEDKFTLGDIIALDHDLSEVGYRSYATTDKELLVRFVAQLADWTQQYGLRFLKGDPAAFDSLRAQRTRWSQAMLEGWRVKRLRAAADDAWHRKDWGRVIDPTLK
jgi:hypothetical protein